jgi:hypothetical protein
MRRCPRGSEGIFHGFHSGRRSESGDVVSGDSGQSARVATIPRVTGEAKNKSRIGTTYNSTNVRNSIG